MRVGRACDIFHLYEIKISGQDNKTFVIHFNQGVHLRVGVSNLFMAYFSSRESDTSIFEDWITTFFRCFLIILISMEKNTHRK